MGRKCRRICDEAKEHFKDCKGCDGYRWYHLVFSAKKQLPYEKGSYCSKCSIWIKEPAYSKIITTTEQFRYNPVLEKVMHVVDVNEDFIDNVVWCLCCFSRARGKIHRKPYWSKKLPQRKLEYEVLDELDEKGKQKTKSLGYKRKKPKVHRDETYKEKGLSNAISDKVFHKKKRELKALQKAIFNTFKPKPPEEEKPVKYYPQQDSVFWNIEGEKTTTGEIQKERRGDWDDDSK